MCFSLVVLPNLLSSPIQLLSCCLSACVGKRAKTDHWMLIAFTHTAHFDVIWLTIELRLIWRLYEWPSLWRSLPHSRSPMSNVQRFSFKFNFPICTWLCAQLEHNYRSINALATSADNTLTHFATNLSFAFACFLFSCFRRDNLLWSSKSCFWWFDCLRNLFQT